MVNAKNVGGDDKIVRELKLKWIKNNTMQILVSSVIDIIIFVLAIIFHKIFLAIFGILFGFFCFFYGRNKMMIYVEEKYYK